MPYFNDTLLKVSGLICRKKFIIKNKADSYIFKPVKTLNYHQRSKEYIYIYI